MTDTAQTPLISKAELPAILKRRTYGAVLELSVRHPLLSPADIALMTGAQEKWVKSVMKSDAFMAQRAARVQELHGPRLEEIRAKMESTMSALLDAIAKRIADPEAAVSEETLLKAFAVLADRIIPAKNAAAIMPPSPTTPTQINYNFNGVTIEDIQRARNAAVERGKVLQLEAQPSHESIIHVDEDGIPKAERVRRNEGLD